MKIWHLVIKEIFFRKLTFAIGLVSIAVAVGCLIASIRLLDIHDIRTQTILDKTETQTRMEMEALVKRIHFTTVILDCATRSMSAA